MTRPPLAVPPLRDLVLAEDPGFYDDRQFSVYDRMRAEAPAYYYEPLDVFLLTRMDDVHYVLHPPAAVLQRQRPDAQPAQDGRRRREQRVRAVQ